MAESATVAQDAISPGLLGPAELDEEDLAALVREHLGRPGLQLQDWWAEPVDYPAGTPSTGLLVRVKGVAADRDGAVRWSVFVKLLQSLRHWQFLHLIPAQILEEQLEYFPWRVEADRYRSDLASLLPQGMRLPRVYRVDDLGDERIVLWLEDVQTIDAPWDIPRFERAAYLLGRLAARRAEDRLAPDERTSPVQALYYYNSARTALTLPMLQDDATWSHPLVAGAVDARLRIDTLTLATRFTAILHALGRLPQTLAHGDASPQNLLVPADDPDSFVVIDWGFSSTLLPVGFDLAQLLVGLSHAGRFDPDKLPTLHEAIITPYATGLRKEGMVVAEEQVRYGYVGSLVMQSALSALPLERLSDQPTPELERLFAIRARLARFIVDLGLAL
ncbi:MAG: phosphotransferase [Egibacteraceae bacterium]